MQKTSSFNQQQKSVQFFGALNILALFLGTLSAYPAVAAAAEEETPAVTCVADVNLITNGSFEKPKITNEYGWQLFDSNLDGLAWIVNWVNPVYAPAVAKLELQGNYYSVSDGVQYAELDSNWNQAPGELLYRGEDARVKISQTIATIPGNEYIFSFDLAAIPHSGPENNAVKVLVDGVVIGNANASGIEKTNTEWTKRTFTFKATGTTTEVALADEGTVDAFGTLVDNVSLTCVPAKVVVTEETTGGTTSSGSRNGGGGRSSSKPKPVVAGISTSTVATTSASVDAVSGDQVSIMPAGAPNAGAGGTSNTDTATLALTILSVLFLAVAAWPKEKYVE